MTLPSLHDLRFTSYVNSDKGQVSPETIFHYRQEGEIVWATYSGGAIRFGVLSGTRTGSSLHFHYQHQDDKGIYHTGICDTQIRIKKGLIYLDETWQWTSGNKEKGTSVLVEMPS